VIGLAAGLILTLAAWAMARTVARAWRSRRLWGWALDLAIPLSMFAAGLVISARPLLAGAVTFALIGGFAFADWGKRQVLREPVVFTDLSELVELVQHPQLYLPYVGTGKVAAGAAAAFAAFVGLAVIEPPLWAQTWLGALAAVAIWAALVVGGATLWLGMSGRLLGRFAIAGEPFADSAALGSLAMQFAYGVPTRAARPAVRAALTGPPAVVRPDRRSPDIVLVQCESFFDPRRLGAPVPADLLPAFDALKETGVQWGRMAPPTWGAGTTRTEFAVLTGAPPEQLGLDAYNPYHALARRPLPSLASVLKAAGYRTVCVHPYARTFYGRHRVMPALGFDAFHGLEAFAGAPRDGRYVSDLAAAEFAARLVRESAEPLFVFVVTVANHGPWPDLGTGGAASALACPGLDGYLAGIAGSDAMIEPLVQALRRHGDGVLGFFGDHMPTLPLGPENGIATDYALWRATATAPPIHVDLPAHRLGEAVLDAAGLLAARGTTAEAA
jgi:hypothetical protein